MAAEVDQFILTPRTVVVPTPPEVVARRMEADDFFAEVDLGPAAEAAGHERFASVRFPPTWPGEAWSAFVGWLERRREGRPAPWVATVVDRESLEAIGQMGCISLPDADGRVEIRYATSAPQRDRGLATEAGGAFVDWLLARADVHAVVSECLVTNAASVRVLEKVGFELVEEREDDEGRMLRWEKRR